MDRARRLQRGRPVTPTGLPGDLHPIEAALIASILAIPTHTADIDPTSTTRTRSDGDASSTRRSSSDTDPHVDVDEMLIATWLEAQITSRLLDHAARRLRADRGVGYYTIGSAGHESNAVVATALRPNDPALLHYRSGGFYVARALQSEAACDPVRDVLRGMMAKSTDQIAGGRHKVFGNHALSIIPQTSTIASHLPRAVGLALSARFAPSATTTWPSDSVVVCSFGDGSLNHSTTQGALNWAAHAHHAGERVPVLFVCEDNGLGLSVPTPPGWVESSLTGRTGLLAATADGADPIGVWSAASGLVDEIRASGRPGVLHLSTVRFLGHAGTDVETAYRSPSELTADLARDPIIATAAVAARTGVSTPNETVDWYLDLRASIDATAREVADEPELLTAAEVMEPLTAPVATSDHDATATPTSPVGVRDGDGLTLAQTITRTLAELIDDSDDVIVFGEDVGRKGGAYGVTRGLQKRFGDRRVFDTLLDEQSILGLALGAALNGRLPIPEIQYLAYLHNAEDQLRGEAATLGFFSRRQYANPMVVRIAGYGYQKGFGGHFHNDNSIAVLRDIPGLVIASPSHPSDAAAMLHACVDHARSTGAVCVYLEPIARYHDADLHDAGDQSWSAAYDPTPVPIGSTRTWGGDGPGDLTILTWGNGLHLSLRAQRTLKHVHQVDAAVVDLRWIAPLPVADMVREAQSSGRVLVVDETRRTGGVGEGIVAELVDAGFRGPLGRVAAKDSFVPLGAAADLVLVGVDDVVAAAMAIVGAGPPENGRSPGDRPGLQRKE